MAEFAPKSLTESGIPAVGSGGTGATSGGVASSGSPIAAGITGLAQIFTQALPAFAEIAKSAQENKVTTDINQAKADLAQGNINQSTYNAQLRQLEHLHAGPGTSARDQEVFNSVFARELGVNPPSIRASQITSTANDAALTVGTQLNPHGTEEERLAIGEKYVSDKLTSEHTLNKLTLLAKNKASTEQEQLNVGTQYVGNLLSTIDEPAKALLATFTTASATANYDTLADAQGYAAQIDNMVSEALIGFEGSMRKAGVTNPAVLKPLREEFEGQAKTLRGLVANSNAKALVAQLDIMQKKFGMGIAQAAPVLSALKSTGMADQALTGFINTLTTKTDINSTIRDELMNAIKYSGDVDTGAQKGPLKLQDILSVLTDPNTTKHVDKGSVPDLFKGSLGAMNRMNTGVVDEKNVLSFGKNVVISGNFALQGEMKKDQLGTLVDKYYGSPQTKAVLLKLQSVDPGIANGVAKKMIGVASKSLREDMKERKGIQMDPNPDKKTGLTTSAVLNTYKYDTAQGEWTLTGKGGTPDGGHIPEETRKVGDRLNRALEVIADLAPYDAGLKHMSRKDVKEWYVQNLGATIGANDLLTPGSKFAERKEPPVDSFDSDKVANARVDFVIGGGMQGILNLGRRNLHNVMNGTTEKTGPDPTQARVTPQKVDTSITSKPLIDPSKIRRIKGG